MLCMNKNMGPDTMSRDVKIKRFKEQMLVKFIREYGKDILVIILTSSCLAFEGCYPGLVKIYHGSLLKTQMHNLMMNQHPVCSMQPTLCHADFTVLKPYVYHGELLLHGQNLQIQNHLPILCTFWRQSIQQKNHVQIKYALIKPA